MKRAALERVRTRQVWLRHRRLNRDVYGRVADLSVGHFRKGLRVGGCGNSQCWLCHAGKLAGDLTLNARRTEITFREEFVEALRSNKSLERSRDG